MGTDAKHRSRSREKYERKRDRSRSRSRDRKKEKKKKSRERDRERGRREERVGGGGGGVAAAAATREHPSSQEREEVEEKHSSRLSALKQEEKQPEKEKEGVNLGLSGALTEETNTFNGIVIKYSEPPEARKPKRRWRFYVFKGQEVMPTLHLHRQSAFLMGRDRKVCDLPIDHPSCSKQHAVFQYRLVTKRTPDGTDMKRVLPYIIDLGSANGTYLNNQRIESQRYYELKEKDMLKFGYSSREYVLLHEDSGDD